MPRIILQGATLIDGNGSSPIPHAVIVIEDGRISAVDTGSVLRADALVMDLTGHTILPGLIDAHVHLVLSGGEDPLADVLAEDDEQLFTRAIANAQAALMSGVTLVRDCGGRGTVVQKVRDAIAAGEIVGPRILASGMAITSPKGHLHFMGVEARGIESVKASTKSQLDQQVDFIKVMGSGGNLTPGTNPSDAQFEESELRTIVDEAHRAGKHVAAHLHSTEAIRRSFAAGVDTFEHCSWLGGEGSAYDETMVSQMAKCGVIVSPAVPSLFRSEVRTWTSDPMRQNFLREFQLIRYQTTRRMREAGVPIIFSTDAGARRTRFADYALAGPIYVERFGLSPMEMIVSATRRASEALGVSSEVGTVTAGKQADLAVVQGNPLTELDALRTVKFVFVSGHKVVENGKIAGARP